MPLPPMPVSYRCTSCHWSKTLVPSSDALMPGEYVTSCPQCGQVLLVVQPATAFEVARETCSAWMQQWRRNTR